MSAPRTLLAFSEQTVLEVILAVCFGGEAALHLALVWRRDWDLVLLSQSLQIHQSPHRGEERLLVRSSVPTESIDRVTGHGGRQNRILVTTLRNQNFGQFTRPMPKDRAFRLLTDFHHGRKLCIGNQ
jgi:hypothetical protein